MICARSRAQTALPQDPAASIVKLFDTYRIVMLGEDPHGCTQEWQLLEKLVATPDFSQRVNDIVMEFGNAHYQEIVDRYIAGENVPVEQVQGAWRDTVGSVGPASPVYGEFYAAVRAANQKLPPQQRLRVLLGILRLAGVKFAAARISVCSCLFATSSTPASFAIKYSRKNERPC